MSVDSSMRAAAALALLAALGAPACSGPGGGTDVRERPGSEAGAVGDAGPGAAPADDDAIVQVIPEGQIPAVDDPAFAGAAEAAAFMRPAEPVVGVVVEGKARAYSLWHLDRHEIVNDRAGESPLLVAWCPIAWTARAFKREVAGRVLTFGVSGRLWRNALVMRDRETGSLWSQVSGAAISGPLQGAELGVVPAAVAPWSEWARLHPATLVLRKPPLDGALYPDYVSDPERVGFYGQRRRDPRLPAKTRVVGVEAGVGALAVPVEFLHERRLWNERVGERAVLLVSLGPEGPALAYERRIGARELTFESGRKQAHDRETGSVWDLATGAALSGPLKGARLQPLAAQSAYWFVWSAFHPGTDVRQAPVAGGEAP